MKMSLVIWNYYIPDLFSDKKTISDNPIEDFPC